MLKPLAFVLFCLMGCNVCWSQTDTLTNTMLEQQLENLADANEGETEDDSYLQQFDDYRRHPMDLNAATESDLKVFIFLKPLQIQHFVQYRQLLGKLISIYELQAVPGWDLETIRRIRPFITVGNAIGLKEDIKIRFSHGENTLLARVSQVLEKANGFMASDSTGPKYKGGRQRILIRYRYQYKNLLQYGLLADKDAGEQLFKGNQKMGFDFYSFHLFARNLGIIKQLAIGDFTVNMGQGLTSWQSLAFRKSADAMGIKRQAETLRPYNSAGEFNFDRGLGVTIGKQNWQATVFASYKSLSANAIPADSLNFEDYVSSIQTSGYHRTIGENEDRNMIKELSYGGNFSFQQKNIHVGLNMVQHQLSKPLQKGAEPYNTFAIGGTSISNASLDYGYTHRNLHMFGEVATDAQGDIAMVHGLMSSLDAKADFSLLYRNISRSYGSLYAAAFTESTAPVNENGLYMGLELRPRTGIRIDMYADLFSFPWLRYRVDCPSKGVEYLAQLTWKPNKQVEMYSRFSYQSKPINLSETGLPMHVTDSRPKQNWRTHFSYKVTSSFIIRGRAEVLWLDQQGSKPENGFLLFADVFYKPLMKPISANVRVQYFESDSYDSRLYAYENDVLYSFSIPPVFGKGYRYYLNINYDVSKKLATWFRISQTLYPGIESIGSGNDKISGPHKTEIKFQVMYQF